MEKAFQNFQWKNAPSTDTPINQTNLNKINNGLNTVDDRVIVLDSQVTNLGTSKASKEAISDEIETLNSAALYAHAEDSFFYASDGKIYKATDDIAVGDTIAVGTNCVLSNIVDNLGGGGSSGSSGHTILDGNGTTYPQRSKLKIENATITDDAQNDATVVTPEGGGGGSSFRVMTQTLTAGNTTVTFTNIPTTGDNLIDFYTSNGIPHIGLNTSVAGQVTLTFDAQSVDVVVTCKIEEIPS